jgi:phosphoglycerate dehydrogenase-like enzyme
VKIVYTPNLIVRELTPAQRVRIMAAEPSAVIVEAKDAATQRAHIPDADVLFGRVAPDIYPLAKRLRLYQSIGAGVDSVLCDELVNDDVPLSSEKGGVGVHLAEHAFALLLAITRGLHTAIRTPDYGLRESIRVDQSELYEQTMGIVGLGGTRRAIAQRAVGFGMPVPRVDIEEVAPAPGGEATWKAGRAGERRGGEE